MTAQVSFSAARRLTVCGLLLAGVAAARPTWTRPLPPRPHTAASYTTTELGTIHGGDASAALALNGSGEVTGYAVDAAGAPHAFVWNPAEGMRDLGTLPGDSRSCGTGINAGGEICGISQGRISTGFVWTEAGGMRPLAPLATGTDTWAYGINASGQIAGMSSYARPGGDMRFGAVVWDSAGEIGSIPALDRSVAGSAAVATGINDAGQVTGYQDVVDGAFSRSQPFIWHPADGLKLLARPAGTSGRPLAINASGQVLGLTIEPNASFPVSWTPSGDRTVRNDVDVLLGAGPFQAGLGGINSAGKIVYTVSTKSGAVAALFQAGVALDLNRLVDPGAAVRLYNAAAVNDSGQIVGALVNGDGSRRAYLLTPGTLAAQLPVNLRTSANFAILSKAGISTTGTTRIVGNIGVSPIASTAITGFGLIRDRSGQYSTSSRVVGKVYAANYAAPTPTMLTAAVSNMQTAYTNAAGRTSPNATELGAGNIGGRVIRPGLYKWSSNVTIPTNVTLSGSSTAVWVFQIAGTLNISSGKRVVLSGGAHPRNIFWQVGGQATLGTTSVFNGNILGKTAVVIKTGARLNGRALAQTAVTLDANAVTRPY